MSDLRASLQAGLQSLQLALDARQVDLLLDYLGLLQKWNKVYNLTAVRDPAEMMTHHLLDSLAVIAPLLRQAGTRSGFAAGPSQDETARSGGSDSCSGGAWGPPGVAAGPSQGDTVPSGGSDPRSGGAWGPHFRLLDVGSGGGLPGVVVAIACPQMDVTCVDTVAKKAAFIQQAAATLKLPNLHGLHARVESLSALSGRGYDVVCSRAFASLADFTRWSQDALNAGGVWMAMKGKHPADELATLRSEMPSVDVFHVEQLQVPGLDAERCIVWMRPMPAAVT